MSKRFTFKHVIRNLSDGGLYGLWIRGYTFQWYYYSTSMGMWVPCTSHALSAKSYKIVANNVLIK